MCLAVELVPSAKYGYVGGGCVGSLRFMFGYQYSA